MFGERIPDGTATLVKHEQIDGNVTALVRIVPPAGLPVHLWIDPATGAFKRAVIDPDGKYETAYNGLGYTAINGKRFPTSWHDGTSRTMYDTTSSR